MKPRDERSALTSSQEAWVSTRLTDPDAALWASITPPANAPLHTRVRRRVGAFSLGLLARRLRLPGGFSAQRGLLAAAGVFGATLGAAGYLAATSLAGPAGPAEAPLRFTSTTATLHPPSVAPPPEAPLPAAPRAGTTTVALADTPEPPALRPALTAKPSPPKVTSRRPRAEARSTARASKRAKATKKRWKKPATKPRRANQRKDEKARQLAAALGRS